MGGQSWIWYARRATTSSIRPICYRIIPSVASFTKSINKLAGRLSVRDNGPFPLCHGDFGHNNVIVDDKYHVLGVIDWETAFAGPLEVFGDFPLNLSTIPPAMDAPWNYDEEGSPRSTDLVRKFADQKDYIAAVRQEENISDGNNHCLSEALRDSRRQQLATAMRLYQNGKVGWYSKLIDEFCVFAPQRKLVWNVCPPKQIVNGARGTRLCDQFASPLWSLN